MNSIFKLFCLAAAVLLTMLVLVLISGAAADILVKYLQWKNDYLLEQLTYVGLKGLCALILFYLVVRIARKSGSAHRDCKMVRWGWCLALAVMLTPILMAAIFSPSLTFEWPDSVDAGKLVLSSLFLISLKAFEEEVTFRVTTFSLGSMLRLHPVALLALQAAIFWALHGWAARISPEAIAWFATFGVLAGVIYYTAGIVAATLTHSVVNFWFAQLDRSDDWLLQSMLNGGGFYWKYPTLNVFVPLSIIALILMILATRSNAQRANPASASPVQAGALEIPA